MFRYWPTILFIASMGTRFIVRNRSKFPLDMPAVVWTWIELFDDVLAAMQLYDKTHDGGRN